MDALKKIIDSENGILAIMISILLLISVFVTLPTIAVFYINDESSAEEWTPKMGSPFETDYTVNLIGKSLYIELNGLMCNFLNQPELNDVIKLNNGHLFRLIGKADEQEMERKVAELKRIVQLLKERDIKFLYVATPYAVSKYDNQLPNGYEEVTNSDIDYFLELLSKNRIDYIDIREEMHAEGINQYDLWYNTDHHWTTRGGFYAFRKIVNWVDSNIGLSIDEAILDEVSYEKKVYPKWHLGSYGQRTGKYFAGIDDFVLYEPKFDTSFGTENKKFCDVMYNYQPLEERDNESRYTYDFVLEQSLGCNINNFALNDKRAMFICDSMGDAVMPFLSLAFRETCSCDAGAITEEFLDEFDPDIVVMLLFPHHLDDKESKYYYFGKLK